MAVEVLVNDKDVKWNHEIDVLVPKDGKDVEGYVKVEICDRQQLQDVSSFVVFILLSSYSPGTRPGTA